MLIVEVVKEQPVEKEVEGKRTTGERDCSLLWNKYLSMLKLVNHATIKHCIDDFAS